MTGTDLDLELSAALMIEEIAHRDLIRAANAASRYIGRDGLATDHVLLELQFLTDAGDLYAARLLAAHRDAAEAYTTARIELADLQNYGTLPTTRR